MTVRPTTSGQASSTGITRAGLPLSPPVPARTNDSPAAATPPARRDDVQISSQARELQQMDASPRAATSDIAPDKLREVLGRISGGYYDQPHVKDAVVRSLASDL